MSQVNNANSFRINRDQVKHTALSLTSAFHARTPSSIVEAWSLLRSSNDCPQSYSICSLYGRTAKLRQAACGSRHFKTTRAFDSLQSIGENEGGSEKSRSLQEKAPVQTKRSLQVSISYHIDQSPELLREHP
jgi:hypothetical protein